MVKKMLTAKDINNKKFEQTRPGYKPEEVDDFLREIALQITQMQKDKEEVEKKIEVLVESVREYKKDEDALKDALIGAQKQGRAVVQEAHENADKIIAEAHIKAEEIIGNTRVQLEKEKHCLSKMQQEVSDFKQNLLSMYKAHLEQITSIPEFEDEDEEEAPAAPTAVEEKPAEQPKVEPAPVNMEATRVVDTAVKKERTAAAFPFESNQSSSESKFGNLKFGNNK
ncbi:MAG: DivIVA domain-containing protein [Oscillospiraceae bacterium]